MEEVYRTEPYAFTIKKKGSEFVVKLLLGPFTTENNIRSGSSHQILGISFEDFQKLFEEKGEGPHTYSVRTLIGPPGTIYQPLGSDRPSR